MKISENKKISEYKKIIENKRVFEIKKIGGNYCQKVLNHKKDKIYWKIIQGDVKKAWGGLRQRFSNLK